MIFFGILDRLKAKYIFSGVLLLLFLLPVLGMALPSGQPAVKPPAAVAVPDSARPFSEPQSRRELRERKRAQRHSERQRRRKQRKEQRRSRQEARRTRKSGTAADTLAALREASPARPLSVPLARTPDAIPIQATDTLPGNAPATETAVSTEGMTPPPGSDSLQPALGPAPGGPLRSGLTPLQFDSLPAYGTAAVDRPQQDSLPADSLRSDTTGTTRKKSFLDDIISGKNQDSLYYDVRNRTVYIYNQGDINYQNMNLKGDFMRVNMDEKIIYAHGKRDTIDGKPTVTNPTFTEGAANPYTMDTITYNIGSKKAKIKGVATQEGDGWLIGNNVKKMDDNTIHIQDGKYTTCDQTDHPHFYLAMTRAKVIPGKKVVTGPAYMVLEDVPIYFPLLPEGFFPLSSGPKSGLLMPTFGEESTKGFYIRDLGYYFTLGEHMDLAIRGGIYTLGSWEASAMSRYMKRYKYNGALNFNYSNVRVGDKGEPDFLQQNNFQLYWQHTQDPKANPGSTFSASVDFRTSGYNRYSATSLDQALQTQTSSTISYSKSWLGTPFSLSANMSVSQNSQSGTLSISLPNIVFNVSTFYPFKRKEAMGKQRWYEKISLRYTGKFNNKANAKESEIFSKETLKNMQYGFEHSIPISATYNIFNYINFGPTVNYTEKWYFKKQEQVWNPVLNRIDKLDPEYGFYRLYNYNFSVQASTIIYGRYEAKKKTRRVQAIRHTITPTVSFSYAPDFSKQKYGYIKTVQSDTLGNFKTYSPFEGSIFGVPSSGQSMSINASLSQTLEMKVLSKRDTSGMKKIKLIDEFRIGQVSYNFLADSMGLSNIPLSLRTTVFQNFGININATLDPYRITPQGRRINKLFFPGRVVSASTSFGYTFRSRQDNSAPAINDINSAPADPAYANPFHDPYGQMDPALRRQYMTRAYYDFSLPWNLGFNYTVSYSSSPTNNGTTGYRKNITQTLGINGSVTILPKMGITFQGGYDFQAKELTPASVTISRDLHCWQMSFAWVPFGHYQSWSFNIGVKAASLSDLKYDKSQSMFDNLY